MRRFPIVQTYVIRIFGGGRNAACHDRVRSSGNIPGFEGAVGGIGI